MDSRLAELFEKWEHENLKLTGEEATEFYSLLDEFVTEDKKLAFRQLEEHDRPWEKAVIVFTEDTWDKPYNLYERSYVIFHNAKYFNPMMNGTSLSGYSLEGQDNGVRLDLYMKGENKWKVDYCYILQ